MSAPLTALYVPGDRPERFAKAVASGADVVLLDLEDAVAPAAKDRARSAVVDWLATRPEGLSVQVRVNALASPWGGADLAALPEGVAVRLPKVESPDDVDAVLRAAGGPRPVHALLESALGVESALEVAQHPGVLSISLGEADLAADLGTTGEGALAWARSRVVVASRAAGLGAPMMSAFAALDDLAGLEASCALGRALGLRGRAAVHPRQVPVIARAFALGADELAWARQVLAALEGGGVAVLPGGAMVDAAMARRARALLG